MLYYILYIMLYYIVYIVLYYIVLYTYIVLYHSTSYYIIFYYLAVQILRFVRFAFCVSNLMAMFQSLRFKTAF